MLKKFIVLIVAVCGLLMLVPSMAAQDELPLPEPDTSMAQAGRNLFVDVPMTRDTANLRAPEVMGAERTRFAAVNFNALSEARTMQYSGRVPNDSGIILNVFDDATYLAVNERLEQRPSGEPGYVWIGSVAGEPLSRVVLVITENGIHGQINRLEASYALQTVAPNLVAITQASSAAQHLTLANDGIPTPPVPANYVAPRSAQNIGMPGTPQADTGEFIDVMVVYTPAAAAAEPSEGTITAKIDSMISVTNQTYIDSAVNQRIRLVHSQQVNYNEVNMESSLERVTFTAGSSDDPSGYMDEVHTLRDQYGADLVALITLEPQYAYCGLGWVMQGTNPANTAFYAQFGFSVTDVRCWSPGFTFAHELGHNMGGVHDKANSIWPGATPYSYGYQDPAQNFVTVMAYPTSGFCPPSYDWRICPPIGRWSDPTASYNGRVTGNSETNMRRTLNETAPLVANFRLEAQLDPFNLLAPGNYDLVTDPAITFEWEDVPDATRYVLGVNTSSGFRYSTEMRDSDVCNGTTCSFSPSGDPAWRPPYGQTLRWRIRALDDGSRASRSDRWRITTAYMDVPTLTEPVNESIEPDTVVVFGWTDDGLADEYRVRLVDPNNIVIYNTWSSAGSVCAGGTCELELDLSALGIPVQNGVYGWRVMARRADVAKKAKSEVRSFTLRIPLNLSGPADGSSVSGPVQYEWEDAGLIEYRIWSVDENGLSTRLPWTPSVDLCTAGVCTLTDSTLIGNFTWRVDGRSPGELIRKVKSARRTLTVTVP